MDPAMHVDPATPAHAARSAAHHATAPRRLASPARPASPRQAATVLPATQWRAAARRHRARIAERTDPLMSLHDDGRRHPVYDFLFTYYSQSAGSLQRWHPGLGVVLADDPAGSAAAAEAEEFGQAPRGQWTHYRRVAPDEHPDAPEGGWAVDAAAFAADRATGIAFIRELLSRTAGREAHLGCFGLHEWAMAYRAEVHGVRHATVPLRLGTEGTNEVVESQRIRCTHFDAFRFFAPEARPLNEEQPTRKSMTAMEQPGCLHGNMDLHKWAGKLTPAIPSGLAADCFELAWEIREMDMMASPYDLADWGFEPIRIETPAGRAEYVRRQRAFSERGQVLRSRLLEALAPLG